MSIIGSSLHKTMFTEKTELMCIAITLTMWFKWRSWPCGTVELYYSKDELYINSYKLGFQMYSQQHGGNLFNLLSTSWSPIRISIATEDPNPPIAIQNCDRMPKKQPHMWKMTSWYEVACFSSAQYVIISKLGPTNMSRTY